VFHITDNNTKHEDAAVILLSIDIPYGHFNITLLPCVRGSLHKILNLKNLLEDVFI